ncbi:MAG: hypothetical protein ACRDH7_10215 [Actinomycetota bacterium]
MTQTHVFPRPRFSRGQERLENDLDVEIGPNFARGQTHIERIGRAHRGDFASGQASQLRHPEYGYEGRFSVGEDNIRQEDLLSG